MGGTRLESPQQARRAVPTGPYRPLASRLWLHRATRVRSRLMVFEQCIRSAGLAVGLMVFEQFIRYASLAVGLKPSATECKARLRGLERSMYSNTRVTRD